MFGAGPLSLFSDAGLAFDIVPTQQGRLPPSAFIDYEALLIGGARVSEAELAGESGKLRVVARNGVGYDAVDTRALSARGILLTNTPLPVRNAVATTAVAFILALSLRLPLKSRLAREGRWKERADHPGIGLPGRTLGIDRPRRDRTGTCPLDATIRDEDPRRRSSRRRGDCGASWRDAAPNSTIS